MEKLCVLFFYFWSTWGSSQQRLVLGFHEGLRNNSGFERGHHFKQRPIVYDFHNEEDRITNNDESLNRDRFGSWYDLVGDVEATDLGKETNDFLELYDPVTETLRHRGGHVNRKTGPGSRKNQNVLDSDETDIEYNTTTNRPQLGGPRFTFTSLEGGSSKNKNDTGCPAKCACQDTKIDCAGKNLTSVPEGIKNHTTWLDLSMNNLQSLPENTFAHMPGLRELRCVRNNLTELPDRLFIRNKFLQLLNFQGNFFTEVPARVFQNLSHLQELHLDANLISTIPKEAFTGLTNLKQLWLDDNQLDLVPVSALKELTGLQALTLIKNQITHIPDFAFIKNTKLLQLRLANNNIRSISDHAFFGLNKLMFLQLQTNKLSTIPAAFSHLESLDELNLEENRLTEIPAGSFRMKEKLTVVMLGNNPITLVSDEAFTNLPSLSELKLSEVHDMTNFPDLTGTMNLNILQLDRASIKSVPKDLCVYLKKLKTLDVHSNKIGIIPEMSQCRQLIILNMANNELTSIEGRLFNGMDHLKDLTLTINYIQTISEDAFVGLDTLEYLNLAENQISEIHPLAFLPLKSLKDLNLGHNRIHHLPTAGLVNLEKLKVFHNPELREFPPKEEFPKVNNFVLSYAYHCCDFMLSRPEHSQVDTIREHIVWLHTNTYQDVMAMWESYGNESKNGTTLNESTTMSSEQMWDSFFKSDYDLPDYPLDSAAATYLEDYKSHPYNQDKTLDKAAISCKPRPGPFMPCDDLFGWWSLRCGIWFVFMLALLGNGVVFFVSMTSKSKMDVPRFLICNLALADFLMGVYLGILAIMDASTLGQFKKYAIQWQMSAGCLAAGTLCVLSSELSVFTLTVITLERFYAITHAMQLSKRLSLKHAGVIMLCGWIWSFGLAILPLFGISDYRKFAVCLPFEIESVLSKTYVCFIMVFNGISFFIILTCYLVMYISIRDSQAWNSNDTRVAKRMALLVFTDFLCWAPIAFLSLAAAFGKNLIHLNEAKVLTIFILPLNSCANPFLYAFFTKQFKKDCVLLCRRLEDSSIARHFSQVSHRNVSVSWKYQRRASALHSLIGENKSNNSQNNSSSSNSYGLVNYNSECFHQSNSRGNLAVGNDTFRSEKRVVHVTRSGGSINGVAGSHRASHKYTHKYKPCPSSDPVEDHDNIGYIKIAYAGGNTDDDVQVILHQDFYSQSGTDTNGCTIETYLNDEDDNYYFLMSQVSCDDLTKDNQGCRRKDSFTCPSIVIHEVESVADDDDDEECVWMKSSLLNSEAELEHIQKQDNGSSSCGYLTTSDCEMQKGTTICGENRKIKKPENQSSLGNICEEDGVDCKQGQITMTTSEKCTDNIDNEWQEQKPGAANKDLESCNEENKACMLTNICSETNNGECNECRKNDSLHTNYHTDSCSLAKLKQHAPSCLVRNAELTESENRHKDCVNSLMPEQVRKGGTHNRKKKMKYDDCQAQQKTRSHLDITSKATTHSSKTDHTNIRMLQNDEVTKPSSFNFEQHTGRTSDFSVFSAVSIKNKSEMRRKKSKHSKKHHHNFRKHSHRSCSQMKQMALPNLDAACNESTSTQQCLNQTTEDSIVPTSVNTTDPFNPTSMNNAFTPEIHNKTDVDKSVHLHYIQQFIEDYRVLYRSNSLNELTQAQLEWVQTLHLPPPKRNTLTTSRQEGYTLLYDETNEQTLPWHQNNTSSQHCVDKCDSKPDPEISTLKNCIDGRPHTILSDSEINDPEL